MKAFDPRTGKMVGYYMGPSASWGDAASDLSQPKLDVPFTQQASAASNELKNKTAAPSQPLTYGVPTFMQQSPTNNVGAYFRVAFWLGRAARVSGSESVRSEGVKALLRGLQVSNLNVSSYTSGLAWLQTWLQPYLKKTTDIGSVQGILVEGARQAFEAGASGVGQKLQRLADPNAIDKAQKSPQAAGGIMSQFWMSLFGQPTPPTWAYGVMAVGGIVAVGYVAQSFSPYLAPRR